MVDNAPTHDGMQYIIASEVKMEKKDDITANKTKRLLPKKDSPTQNRDSKTATKPTHKRMLGNNKNATNKNTLSATPSDTKSAIGGTQKPLIIPKAKQTTPASGATISTTKSEALGLSMQEREARLAAIKNAATKGDDLSFKEHSEALARVQAEAKKLEEEEKNRRIEDQKRRQQEETERRQSEEQIKRKAEEMAARNIPKPTVNTLSKPAIASHDNDVSDEEKRNQNNKRNKTTRRVEDRRRQGKVTVNQLLDEEEQEYERMPSIASIKRARAKERQKLQTPIEREKILRDVVIPETISVGDLANRMAEPVKDVIKALMKNGIMGTSSHMLDGDTAELIVSEFKHTVKRVSEADIEEVLHLRTEDNPEDLVGRAPIVTIMGHVDHGKTSLLDTLRESDVASGEAGGITQHIGAYQIKLKNGQYITFLDTPGHEAFTQMRGRGAQITDIVVLVVAADDGIQPQTIEAINHAKAANVPLIVAINKIDREDTDIMRIKTQLLEHEVQLEEMGGDVLHAEISAKNKINIDGLIDSILLTAEMQELKANPKRDAEGTVIEVELERGRGIIATALVQTGTLAIGDIIVAGPHWGRVRSLLNERGKNLAKAGPSTPVEIMGLQGLPEAGDKFIVLNDEQKSRQIAEYRQEKIRNTRLAVTKPSNIEAMFSQIKTGTISHLPLVIKTDVQGSLEAIKNGIENFATDEVAAKILHIAVGGITESDVSLAQSNEGFVVGFNVRANAQARTLANRDNVDIRYYSVIYDLLDNIKNMLSGMLAPDITEEFLGYAEIRDVFNITKVGKIAGCMVTEGNVKRGAKIRLLRNDTVIYTGALKQLKRFKDDVKDVNHGYECGIALENFDDIKPNDIIECYDLIETERNL